ncbi:hypothetical protein [Actinomadura parmotrematis]|uniref:DUF3618 domain-containing protein n=1 Tax=Actinomadura parmotrematis TaxID=2864039 RepID=A0ABS7FNC0_9ACTN|nr:hypothetical protein [Actinomadura parmotrematis]MBW8481811.1 hypothetical protein [Actinomadura parmotrematis]
MARVQDAYRQSSEFAKQNAADAAERIAPAAQHTRDVAAERLLQARGWSAPRLEQAAQYVEAELAPRVSSLLSDAASYVEPEPPARRGRKFILLAVATVAAAGVVGVLLTRRSAQSDPLFEEPVADSATAVDADGTVRPAP